MTEVKEVESESHEDAVGVGGDFVTFTIAGQLFGVPVLAVQDVLRPQAITRIPMAPPEILGSLNLRGRIVTVVDTRHRLGLPKAAADEKPMSIVVPHGDDLFSLAVDRVGEVLTSECPELGAESRDARSGLARSGQRHLSPEGGVAGSDRRGPALAS